MKQNATVFSIVVIGVLAVLGLVAMATLTYYNHVSHVPASVMPVSPSSTIVTRTGELTCLPHKVHGGPETLECAIGLKGDDAHYYALKNLNSQGMQQNKKLRVTGTLEQPSTNQIYDITGVISVTAVSYL